MVLRHSLTLGLLRGGFLRAPHCRRRLALRAGEGAAPEALPAASAYHTPVMGNECVDWLVTKRDGFYVDGTLGGGGHSSLILAKLGDGGRLVGVDRDAAAIEAAGDRLAADGRFSSVHANYDAGVRRAVRAARPFERPLQRAALLQHRRQLLIALKVGELRGQRRQLGAPRVDVQGDEVALGEARFYVAERPEEDDALLARLPPLAMMVGGAESLLADVVTFAQKAGATGNVAAQSTVLDGMWHDREELQQLQAAMTDNMVRYQKEIMKLRQDAGLAPKSGKPSPAVRKPSPRPPLASTHSPLGRSPKSQHLSNFGLSEFLIGCVVHDLPLPPSSATSTSAFGSERTAIRTNASDTSPNSPESPLRMPDALSAHAWNAPRTPSGSVGGAGGGGGGGCGGGGGDGGLTPLTTNSYSLVAVPSAEVTRRWTRKSFTAAAFTGATYSRRPVARPSERSPPDDARSGSTCDHADHPPVVSSMRKARWASSCRGTAMKRE